MKLSRRRMFGSAVAAPFALSVGRSAQGALAPPPYTLSINIEIMFPRDMPRAQRMERVAAQGFKAFSFWVASDEEQEGMLKIQQSTGLKCASISGTSTAGTSTGLTMPGAEKTYFEEITRFCKVAKKFGADVTIIFVGRVQPDVPWATQRAQIVNGLRKAGDIAKDFGVVLSLEPLSSRSGGQPPRPRMALDTAAEAFPVIEEVAHPNVKVCFDIYHLQLTEGNITNHLREGVEKGLIKLVQIGDVPGRKEPGTGEINYPHLFAVLRQVGYKGYLDTEMGTTSTPEHAMEVARKLSMEN